MTSTATVPIGVAQDPPLVIENLGVTYRSGARVLRGVDLLIRPGEVVGLVGESGSGKTTLGRAALGLLGRGTQLCGSVRVNGTEINGASEGTKRRLRGTTLGFVAQSPMQSFDPLMTVAQSVSEAWKVKGRRADQTEITATLESLGIENAQAKSRQRPHQWSGGMLQRAAITAAAALTPALIIADEPTSALDADRADSVLASLKDVGTAVLLISHDLSLVSRFADSISVMYAGRIVEHGPAQRILNHPEHPYTAALLNATPRAGRGLPVALAGAPPRLDGQITGCAFAPRCPRAQARCRDELPAEAHGVACFSPLYEIDPAVPAPHSPRRLTVEEETA
jgi:peptide/nickel transport system ATP-binding protein